MVMIREEASWNGSVLAAEQDIPLRLGPRLAALAELVTQEMAAVQGEGGNPWRTLADIGSDHAYLPAYLLRQGVVDKGIATDVNEGPFRNILRTVEICGLRECLEARRGDGLTVLRPGEAGCIVMAGMGGATMAKILCDGAAVTDQALSLVLQPQNAFERICRVLLDAGWQLAEETLAEENRETYRLMAWRCGTWFCEHAPGGVAGGEDRKSGEDRDALARPWNMADIDEYITRWREQACPASDAGIFARCIWHLGPRNIARRDESLREPAGLELERLVRAATGLGRSERNENEGRRREVAAAITVWEGLLKWLFP